MKKLILIIVAVAASLNVDAQNGAYAVFYGVNLTQFHTGSGHGSSYVMNTNIQKGRKLIEMGMVYQDQDKRISGGDVKYKIYLGKNAYSDSHSKKSGITAKPYIHYNCIYHSSKVNTPDFIPPGAKKSTYPELPSTPGTVATMEHYTGMGMQVYVSKNISIDGSVGMGAYVGSLDQYAAPNTLGIHKDNYGFVLAFEFGLDYKFGI